MLSLPGRNRGHHKCRNGGAALTEEELEWLSRRVYRAYAALPEADGRQVDPALLAEKLLGLRVDYRRLSRDGSILGITSPESVGVPVIVPVSGSRLRPSGRLPLASSYLMGSVPLA